MSEQGSGYVVVFCYTEAAGGYKGVKTWTTFPDKAAFDAEFAARGTMVDGRKILGEEEVIAEGCTEEEAVEHVRTTRLRTYVSAALEDARRPDGSIDMEYAELKAANAALMFAFERRTNV